LQLACRTPSGTSLATIAGGARCCAQLEEANVLSTILVVLVVLWLLGMVSSYTMGGFVHLLLVVAIAIVLIRVIQGRRPF
jgi:chromate transport protein ChrA